MSRFWRAFALVGLLSLAPSTAHAAATAWVGDTHAAVRLITAGEGIAGAARVQAGLEFRFAPGWHGYWRTPGDAGLPPAIDWSQSNNLGQTEVAWPAPSRLVVEGLQNSVYTGQFVLPVVLHPANTAMAAEVRVSVGYAACAKVCVPFSADLALTIPAGEGARSIEAPLIEAALTEVPTTPAKAGIAVKQISVAQNGAGRTLVVDLRSEKEPFIAPDLFVEGAGDGIPPAPHVDLSDAGHDARLTVALSGPAATQPLTLTLTDGARAVEFTSGAPSPPIAREVQGWIAILTTALIGGLILNLMPCVLPVLSIKLLAVTRHAEHGTRATRLGFVATALGIIACFGAIALALIGLKLSGATVGWGIQFQQPLFLAAMAMITVLFAASLFDWLQITVPDALTRLGGGRSRGPLIEPFLTGAVATLLATPCSAPFVGTAVGFALAQGPGEIVAVFLCLGLGMSLPYWTIAAFPSLVRWLPRPGAWMLALRKGLGVLMLGTTAWLLVVLWSTAGGLVAVVCGSLLAALLAYRAWLHAGGTVANAQASTKTVTAVLAIGSLAVVLLPASAAQRSVPDSDWQAFDPGAVPALVNEGKTVLVDVTATWCLTCKVNELTALDRIEVKGRLSGPNVIRMRADWSRPNDAISQYLAGFSRYGIPLDVVYGPALPQGKALPEVLTPGIVLDAVARASAKPAVSASTP